MTYPIFNNNFTRNEESDKIKSNNSSKPVNSYQTLLNQALKLSQQQKNINSAHRAKQGGFISDAQYKSNLEKNGVKIEKEKTYEFKLPELNANQNGVPEINTIKVKIPNEKLEQERLRDLTGQWDLKKIDQDELDNHITLKNKRSDDYYREIVNDKEQKKRLDEAFGPRTNFSLSNYENNYDKFNQEEKEMFTRKMQLEFNRQGYKGKDGYRLKTDGILGPNTRKALNHYKKDNFDDYKEAVELKNRGSFEPLTTYDELVLKDKNGKPILLASADHSLDGLLVSSLGEESNNKGKKVSNTNTKSKNSDNEVKNSQIFRNVFATTKDRDKEVLDKEDYKKVQMYKAVYNYGKYELKDDAIADSAHREAAKIRQQEKYSEYEDYGPARVKKFDSTKGFQYVGVEGYRDNDYEYSDTKDTASIIFSRPLTDDDIQWITGSILGTISDANAFTDQYPVLNIFSGILDLILSKVHPLYGKISSGDIIITVKRHKGGYKGSTQEEYKLYYNPNKNKIYHVKK